MAIVRATKNGNWSDTTVWNTGSLPTSADDVYANNFTVTIDISVTVSSINNLATTGVTVGGSFTLNDGITVTASNGFFTGSPNATLPRLMTYSGNGSITLNGNIIGAISQGANSTHNTALLITSNIGQVTINGNLTAIGGINALTPVVRHLVVSSASNLIVNGNITVSGGVGIESTIGIVTVNGNILVNSNTGISNTSGAITITGNITVNGGTAITNTSGTVTITGDITSNGGNGINNASGTVTVVGQLSISSVQTLNVILSGGGVVNFIGQITAGIPGNGILQNAIVIDGGILNVTGDVLANGSQGNANPAFSKAILVRSIATVNITGTVYGPTFKPPLSNLIAGRQTAFAVENNSSGLVSIIGNCIGNISYIDQNSLSRVQYNAVNNSSTGIIDITGNVLAGSSGIAVANISTGTININGDVIGGQICPGALNTSTGTIDIIGVAEGGVSFAGVENDLSNGTILVQKIKFGANGQSATRGYVKFKNTPQIAAEDVLLDDSTTTNLVDINVVPGLQPSISDVRLGVTYSSGSLTGTMNVPPFNAVKAGVPVDNGVGTAALTPEDVWNVLISGITQSGSIGERLKNVATVETTGTQLASFNV